MKQPDTDTAHLGAPLTLLTSLTSSPPARFLSTCLFISLIKAFMIPAFMVLARATVNPTYASANCLLRLVNVTAPAHYANHPYWKDLEYNDECPDEASLGTFVLDQLQGKAVETEYSLFINANRAFFVVACLSTADFVRANGAIPLLLAVRQNLISCFFTMALLFMFVHFENDNTYFVGNILHHADISRWTDKSNASTVDNIPQGFLFTYCCNIVWLMTAIGAMFKLDPAGCLKKGTGFITAAQIFFSAQYFKWFLENRHTKFHDLARPEWKDALPFSFKYKAYHHVFVHHDDGDSFGSSAAFDGFFSKCFHLFADLHNKYGGGLGGVNSPKHYLFCIVFDAVMGGVILCMVYAMLATAAYLFDTPDKSIFRRSLTSLFTCLSLAFFALTVGMLEDQEGDFRPWLKALDMPPLPHNEL